LRTLLGTNSWLLRTTSFASVRTKSSEASRSSAANFALPSARGRLHQSPEAAAVRALPLVIGRAAIERNLRRLPGARNALDAGIATTTACVVVLRRGACLLAELRRRRGDVLRGDALAGLAAAPKARSLFSIASTAFFAWLMFLRTLLGTNSWLLRTISFSSVGSTSSEALRSSAANFALPSARRRLHQSTEAAAVRALPLVIARAAMQRNLRRLHGATDALDAGIASATACVVILRRRACLLAECRRWRGDGLCGGALAGATGAIATVGFTSAFRGGRTEEPTGKGDAGLAIPMGEAMLRSADMRFSCELLEDDLTVPRRRVYVLEL